MLKIDDPKFIALVEKGITIKKLEKRLRPELGLKNHEAEAKKHDGYGDYSTEGFLGKDESLVEVVHSDWKIVERYKTIHVAIAEALEKLIKGKYKLHRDYKYMKPTAFTAGEQSCPWGCNAYGQNAGVILRKGLSPMQEMAASISQMGGIGNVFNQMTNEMASEFGKNDHGYIRMKRIKKNLKQKTEILYVPLTGLLPHLIREHYFFEGRESPYRADPYFLISALNLGSVR